MYVIFEVPTSFSHSIIPLSAQGCISELVVGVRQIALQGTGTEFSEGVTECDTCALNPCLNNGVCQPAPTPAGYSCLCIPGFTGDTCLHTGKRPKLPQFIEQFIYLFNLSIFRRLEF